VPLKPDHRRARRPRPGWCPSSSTRRAGFRLARGGAAEVYGISADVVVFGGALGGGMSQLGAVTWANALAATIGDDLPAPPQPIAVLAASATLSVLRNDAVHQRLEERGAQLQVGVEALGERFGRHLRCNRVGLIFTCFFSRQALTDGKSFARVDQPTWTRFARGRARPAPPRPAAHRRPHLSHAHGVKRREHALLGMEQALRRMQKEDELSLVPVRGGQAWTSGK
jgi:glutamate-1-semialdehyde 2,1-aminomutase